MQRNDWIGIRKPVLSENHSMPACQYFKRLKWLLVFSRQSQPLSFSPVGERPLSKTSLSLRRLEATLGGSLRPGGSWAPPRERCVARQRVAVIVPFRDRHSHLVMLLGVLHPILQRQLLNYTVFVVEQVLCVVLMRGELKRRAEDWQK